MATAIQGGRHLRLPAQANVLIGRDQDIDEACRVLLRPDTHLLTLVGSGGIGKTRLALGMADALGQRFEDGVCFVDLTHIKDGASFPSLLATQLNVSAPDLSTLQSVTIDLRDRQLLLILDNFEHVLSAAPMVAALMEQSPNLKVLATSREPLRLPEEQSWHVRGLELPDAIDRPSAEDLGTVASVALFLQRAYAVNVQFTITGQILRQIAELCVRLEGIPLAIELAAARTGTLSLSTLLQRYGQTLEVLRQHSRDAPARHQSIHATLEWSYRLLSEQEQAYFRHLGVFVGGFSLDAVKALIGGEGESRDALAMLSILTDKGLVTADVDMHSEPRFRLLEAVRGYALELLDRSGSREEVERRHALYYLALAERESEHLRFSGPFVFSPPLAAATPHGAPRPPWPSELDGERANLQTALSFSIDHGDGITLLRLAGALGRYWWVRGFLREGTRWLEEALARSGDGAPEWRSQALSGLGVIARQQGDFERAHEFLVAAVALSRPLDDPRLLAAQLVDLGTVLGHLSRHAEAVAVLEESTGLSRTMSDDWGTAAALTVLGGISIMHGNGERAEQQLAQAVHLFRGLDDRRSLAIAAVMQARAMQMQGDSGRALPVLEDALQSFPVQGQDVMMAEVVESTACVLAGSPAPEVCARLLGVREAYRARGYKRLPFQQVFHDEGRALVEERLGHKTLAAAMEEGTRLSPEQAVAEALALVQTVMAAHAEADDKPERTASVRLSQREHQVLVLLANGHSNKKIGERLGCSDNTVRYHIKSILTKLGVSSRMEAVKLALQDGLLEHM